MALRFGVVLSGCGVFDGAEIREAVLTLLAIDELRAEAQCLAPDVPQMHVVNHLKSEPADVAPRNVLEESARIARGHILRLRQAQATDFDAWVWPGGFGVAKNLCNFATHGPGCDVEPEAAHLIREAHRAGIPQAFICISPVLAARALQLGGTTGVHLTIGDDAGTAEAIEAMGQIHQNCKVDDIVVDDHHRIVSTPAYMYGSARLADINHGITGAIRALQAMLPQGASAWH